MKSFNASRPRKSDASVASWVALTVLAAFLGLSATAAAGSMLDPEVADAVGDANLVARFADTQENETIRDALYANQTLYDLKAAWIAYETRDDFHLFIQVADLPDGWGLPADAPSEVPASINASVIRLIAHFNITGQAYQAVASLYSPSEGEIVPSFNLVNATGEQPLAGAVDTMGDVVRMKIPKALVGAMDGAKLEKFFVHSKYGSFVADYAPDATYLEPPGAPGVPEPPGLPPLEPPTLPEPGNLTSQVVVPETVVPNYGRDYVFGQYPIPPPPSTGTPQPLIKLKAELVQDTIRPGETASYPLMLSNDGAAPDKVVLALSSASNGWAHEIIGGNGEISLAAGAEKPLLLMVSASDSATGSIRSTVSFSSQAGQMGSVSILTLASMGPAPSDGPDSSGDGSTKGGSSPSVGIIGLLAVAALAVAVLRRRRA